MLHLSTLRNQSFNYLFQKYPLVKVEVQGCALRTHFLLLLLFMCVFLVVSIFCFSLGCKDTVWKEALIHVYLIHSLPNC